MSSRVKINEPRLSILENVSNRDTTRMRPRHETRSTRKKSDKKPSRFKSDIECNVS